jgi:NADH-quinone oxidoreductase subunit C
LSADETTTAEEGTEAEEEAPEVAPEEVAETDELREGIVERLRHHLGDDLVEHHLHPGDDLWVRVTPAAWRRTAEVLRDELGCRYFGFVSGLDWKPSPWGRGEDDPTEAPKERPTAIEQGYAGGDTRFQVFARLVNLAEAWGVTVKADVPDDTMEVESWSQVFAGADWHERETWEMFGISFAGHPGLRNIYLPGDFEGHPLRKDFPLLARHVKPWPGIVDVEPMPKGAGAESEADAEAESDAEADDTAEAEGESA